MSGWKQAKVGGVHVRCYWRNPDRVATFDEMDLHKVPDVGDDIEIVGECKGRVAEVHRHQYLINVAVAPTSDMEK